MHEHIHGCDTYDCSDLDSRKLKDLATLPLEELFGNLKVYEMVLDNDGVASKAIKEKAKSLALKAKVTREQTSDNSTCQDESDEDEEINLMAINFKKFPRKGVKVHDKFDICQVKGKGHERECYNCDSKNHRASKCPKPNNKAFVEVT
ncbi:putative reverse transcriptase domain-containing protein [Tanacetum coccineum]